MRFIGIAEIAQTKRGRIRQVIHTALGFLKRQRRWFSLQERRTNRRRCTKQIRNDPTETIVIADNAEIARRNFLFGISARDITALRLPECHWQREIVVHAGNGLHQRAVAIFQPFTIQRFKASGVRSAVLCQFDVLTFCDVAWHT
ncbi:Uncharacterised protein [Shigella flexneri]|nr:Uncharacterised protein [Shigella flexneri]